VDPKPRASQRCVRELPTHAQGSTCSRDVYRPLLV
jgi:hypothetical protein